VAIAEQALAAESGHSPKGNALLMSLNKKLRAVQINAQILPLPKDNKIERWLAIEAHGICASTVSANEPHG
jgi:hypothetical protein